MFNQIKFNFWKHHLGKILEIHQSGYYDLNISSSLVELLENIQTIGTNNIDLYYGPSMPEDIFKHIINILDKLKAGSDITQYVNWIGNKAYKKLMMYDGSTWVFTIGDEPEKYIHIHPARNSIHVIRLNAHWWKTAVLFYFLNSECNDWIFLAQNIKYVNKLRKDYLNLSPVKILKNKNKLIKGLMLLYRNSNLE